MAIIKPERVAFETDVDIIDYVSRGMVPTKKNFEKIAYKLLNPDENDIPKIDDNVYISQDLLGYRDPETMEFVLRRVYANRVRNRNIAFGIAGAIGGIVLLSMLSSHRKKKHISDIELNIDGFSTDVSIDDGPEVTI